MFNSPKLFMPKSKGKRETTSLPINRVRLLHRLTKKDRLSHLTGMWVLKQFNLSDTERKQANNYMASDVGKLVTQKIKELV